MRFVSIFIYLKIRRYENPEGPPHGVQRQTIGSPADYQYYPENSVANPNYEQNVLLDSRRPDQGDGNSYSVPPSAPSGKNFFFFTCFLRFLFRFWPKNNIEKTSV